MSRFPDRFPGGSENGFTLRYEELRDGWCRASVAEHPAVAAEAPTRAEAREAALVALMGVLEARGELKPVRPLAA